MTRSELAQEIARGLRLESKQEDSGVMTISLIFNGVTVDKVRFTGTKIPSAKKVL